MTNRYNFDEKRHLHTLDGKPLTGVTTILSIISKGDGLIQWSANEAVKWLQEHPEDFDGAKTAWKTQRDNAGTKGKDVHAEIETIIKEAIAKDGYLITTKHENIQVQNFIDWAISKKVKFLESEKNVWSEILWVGGIVDFICEIEDEVYIGDIKTAKSIYPSNFWQTAGYQMCLQEMGLYPKVKGHIIVNPKKDGGFETRENYAYENNAEGFKACLTIYRKLNNIS